MTTPSFCANCGTRLTPQIRFCQSCGFPVAPSDPFPLSGPPPAPTLGSNEIAVHKKGKNLWLPLFMLFDFIVALAVLWWLGWLNPALWSQWLEKTLPTNTGHSVVTFPTSRGNKVDANAVSLEDFVGFWMVREGATGENGEAIFNMSLEGNIIVVEVEGDRVELPVLNGRKLEGSVLEDGMSIPVTVELNQNKDQIIVTVLPPHSELQVGWTKQ